MVIYMVLEKQVCQSVNWNTISVLLSWYPMHMYFEHCILHSIHICLMLSKKLEGNAKSYRFVQLRYINFNFKKVLYFLFSKTKLLKYGLEYFRSQ